jgi:hypothetical protein
MKANFKTLLLLLPYSVGGLFAQTGALEGNFELLKSHCIRETAMTPDTMVYVRCSDDRDLLPRKGSFRFFWGDSMQILQYAEQRIVLGDTFVTSSSGETLFKLDILPLGSGQQLAMLKGHCRRSFFYTLHQDTLRTSQVRMGELPVSFAPRSSKPCDTLGLQLLLPWLVCAMREGHEDVIKIWVDDPDAGSDKRSSQRRVKKRLAILEHYLQDGLGDSKMYLLNPRPLPGKRKAESFTVTYMIQ